jgi:glycosyltransferase involved in cell wall biosynthesis
MRVLHLDAATHGGAGQNQVRLLMRALAGQKLEQVCVMPAGSPLEARLRAEDLPYEAVRGTEGPGARFTRAAIRRARGVDVIHSHDEGALSAGYWAARLRRVRWVATCRVLASETPLRWNRADRVIAISEAVRDSLVTSGVDAGRVQVIHSGIDADEIRRLPAMVPSLRDRLAFAPGRFLAGSVGSLHAFRNQRLVAQAAARARDLAWVVIGDGPEHHAIRAAIAAHGVEENVRLVGNIADPRTALRELDVVVAPATGEALGTGILEAMALDLPVLAADDAGAAEILGPVAAAAGIGLFRPGDPAALAAAVLRLQADAELRAGLIAAQRNRLAAFSIDRTARATLALYQQLAATGR